MGKDRKIDQGNVTFLVHWWGYNGYRKQQILGGEPPRARIGLEACDNRFFSARRQDFSG